MLLKRLTNWFNTSKQYFFVYKEGFFNLSYLSNSPELIIRSSERMPFMKVDREKQMLYLDTPFVKGNCFFAELEEGLWILNPKMYYKNNVSYRPIYDEFLPSNYYCLTFNFVENEYDSEFFESNSYKVENQSLSFIQPKGDFLHCHFKGSKERMYIIYFNEEWADKNILNAPNVLPETLDLFTNSDKKFINLKYNDNFFGEIIQNFDFTFSNSHKPDFLVLKKLTYNILDTFFNKVGYIEGLKFNNLKLKDHIIVEKVEHFLMGNLYGKFPGIDHISKKFKISPTKLKTDFKKMYGVSLFKYFQNKQMDSAYDYIESNELFIKDVAQKFGYENVSKFTKAFHKKHNVLPSHVK